jgi:hypothetical protein
MCQFRTAAALAFAAAVAFAAFFQFAKWGPVGAISPFAQDPVDAIGSFAIQVAVAAGFLALAHATRLGPNNDPLTRSVKAHLAVHCSATVVAVLLLGRFLGIRPFAD